MGTKLLADTDVLIDFLRGQDDAVRFVGSHATEIALSTVSAAELYAGCRGDQEIEQMDEFIGIFEIIPVTEEIARQGGRYKGLYHKSHGVGLADGLIAATAVLHNLDLKTLNTKHYPMLRGIKPPYSKR
jgi:predicted nucleic acid-binding protein